MVENAYLMKNTLSILSLPTSTSANESSNWDKNKNNQFTTIYNMTAIIMRKLICD